MSAERTVAIYSDPGRTSMFVRRLLTEDTEDAVVDHDSNTKPEPARQPGPTSSGDPQQKHWCAGARVIHHQRLLPLRTDGTLDLDEVLKWTHEDQVEITMVVTEIPRMAARWPKIIELHFAERLAVISLPTLGPVGVLRSLRQALNRAISALSTPVLKPALYDPAVSGETAPESQAIKPSPKTLAQRIDGGFGSQVVEQTGHQSLYITTAHGVPGRLWTTLGMVATNEPLMAMRKLTNMFSAAVALSGFGIFYSVIWEMATALSWWRLGAGSAACIALLATWLIVSNRLWDRPGVVGKREAFMYNASTVTTLLASTAVLYVLLFIGVLSMSSLIIDPAFMEREIDEPATFSRYVEVAWLSASLGSLAGAIGVTFDSSAHRENLTQGSREYQRYPRDQAQK